MGLNTVLRYRAACDEKHVHEKSVKSDEKLAFKGAGSGSHDPFKNCCDQRCTRWRPSGWEFTR